jgi:hypothetical protein
MTPEDKQALEFHLQEIAQILYKNTPADKLKDFESTELEVREQLLSEVSPKIGEFFLRKEKRQ